MNLNGAIVFKKGEVLRKAVVMKRKIIAFSVVLVLVFALSVPLFADVVYTPGSGSMSDPYLSGTAASTYIPEARFSIYFKKNIGDSIFGFVCEDVVFVSGSTYYLYIPSSVSLYYLYTLDQETYSPHQQTYTLEDTVDDWKIYSFVASSDGYGARIHSSLPKGSLFYFDTQLHAPMSVSELTIGTSRAVLDVGSAFINFVTSNWILMVSLAVFVAVGLLGVSRRFLKGV